MICTYVTYQSEKATNYTLISKLHPHFTFISLIIIIIQQLSTYRIHHLGDTHLLYVIIYIKIVHQIDQCNRDKTNLLSKDK